MGSTCFSPIFSGFCWLTRKRKNENNLQQPQWSICETCKVSIQFTYENRQYFNGCIICKILFVLDSHQVQCEFAVSPSYMLCRHNMRCLLSRYLTSTFSFIWRERWKIFPSHNMCSLIEGNIRNDKGKKKKKNIIALNLRVKINLHFLHIAWDLRN